MNSMRISNNNNYNLQNSYELRFNPYQNHNLISYENSMNLVNQSYNGEKELYNDNINIKEKFPEIEEDEPIIPERSLTDYINDQFLSDAILKLNDIQFYFHRIILISCSDYINNYFISLKNNNNSETKPLEEIKPENEGNTEIKDCQNKDQNKIIINFPEIISSSFGGGNKKNCLEKILKYCYSNQNFKSIESDINQYNIFTLLEMSHSLGIKSLKLNLENKIIKKYLGKDNATKLALESKIFDLKKLNKEAINYITENFKEVKIFKNDIIDLDFESFKNLMNSDKINIFSEKDISEFILDYIKSRRDLPEEEKEKLELKETQINSNENNNKNDDINQENRENINNEEEKKEENEEKKDEEKKEDEIKENDANEKWKKYLYELKDSIKRKKLSKEQEKELIMCIRFAYIPHNELVKLTNEPMMSDFKDILLQALSLKLKSYEENQNNEIETKNIFNSNPRICFQKIEKSINPQNNYDNIMNINQSMPNPNINNIYPKTSFNYNNDPNNRMYISDFYNIKRNNNYNEKINEEEYHYNNNDNIDNYNDYNDEDYNENNNSSSEDHSNNSDILKADYFNINYQKEKEKINRYQKLLKSESPNRNKNSQEINLSKSITSEEENKSKNININKRKYNTKFKYKSDFDHNGALYYLGTQGLTKKYENPHKLKLIKAFGSSLLSGNFYDFVGRKFTNLSTENEENSFFGIDLGPERYLKPTSYSIRNRDSDTNVLLCWNFQGSNDKINFEILDKRIFMSEKDEKLNDKTRKCRHMLKKPRTTSTWGISKSIREKYPNGFRYFLLKQIGKNSSKNYNLAISGFELYGEALGSGWIFN